jgi:hypothetical protein
MDMKWKKLLQEGYEIILLGGEELHKKNELQYYLAWATKVQNINGRIIQIKIFKEG